MKKKSLIKCGCLLLLMQTFISCGSTKKVYSISVPEEGSINFVKLTENSDVVLGPSFGYSFAFRALVFTVNPLLAVSPDGTKIAYLSRKEVSKTNHRDNIMVKSTDRAGASVQRTFRSVVNDVSWSPDGKYLCFSETRSNKSAIYQVNANEGSIVQQISNGLSDDYCPVYSQDNNLIYFSRLDTYGQGIWSYNRSNGLFSNYCQGMTPFAVKGEKSTILCTRKTGTGDLEIWKVNYDTGVEQVILSQPKKCFTTPQLSPDGKWVLCVGNTVLPQSKKQNLDIYVVRIDGTGFAQLTYHPGNDASPVWAPDGKSIYFISERGTIAGNYNIWKMNFSL